MEYVSVISPIVSTLALMWAVYTFVIKRREEESKRERDSLYMAVRNVEESFKSSLTSTSTEIKDLRNEFMRLKESFLQFQPRISANNEQLTEAFKRIEKLVERYEDKLDAFGKVIMK